MFAFVRRKRKSARIVLWSNRGLVLKPPTLLVGLFGILAIHDVQSIKVETPFVRNSVQRVIATCGNIVLQYFPEESPAGSGILDLRMRSSES